MSLQNTSPVTTKAWQKLALHFKDTKGKLLKDLFFSDNERAKTLTIKWNNFLVDFYKNRIISETLCQLLQLADAVHLKDAIKKQSNGDSINQTEGRAVLHAALRARCTSIKSSFRV